MFDFNNNEAIANRRLVVTDLDGTLIGDDDAMLNLWGELDAQSITLAFCTGRHLQSILEFYCDKRLDRRAPICICMVGTDIYFQHDGQYILDSQWHDHIASDWDKRSVESILHAIPEARLQALQWQSRFKCSYFLEEDVDRRLEEIHQRLAGSGIKAKVVYSAGKYLDLLPIRSGKGEAVRYVAGQLGMSPDCVVTCGDSGNDLDMMRPELGFHGIAVGNASPELRQVHSPDMYQARAEHAAGIMEGLVALGWL